MMKYLKWIIGMIVGAARGFSTSVKTQAFVSKFTLRIEWILCTAMRNYYQILAQPSRAIALPRAIAVKDELSVPQVQLYSDEFPSSL
jgi:hypothetical protein